MPYNINKTDGTILSTIADGTINTDTSMTIIGKNYSGYGEFLGENFIKLLESGANTTEPANSLIGQLWYDKTTNALKVFTGTQYKSTGTVNSVVDEPTNATIGELWFDPTSNALKVFDGVVFITVGLNVSPGVGRSGRFAEVITDSIGIDHTCLVDYISDNIVTITSIDPSFIPAITLPGFVTIEPGTNLASAINGVNLTAN